MTSKKTVPTDEIDLIDVINVINENKFKIILITFFAAALMFGYQSTLSYKIKYKVTAEIKPVSIYKILNYSSYNTYINKVSRKDVSNVPLIKVADHKLSEKIDANFLMDFYLEAINNNNHLKNTIKNFNIIKKENYQDLELYDNAVKNFTASIKIIAPTKGQNTNWKIEAITDDTLEWKKFLKYFDESTNEISRNYLENYFEQFFLNQKELKKFAIEDMQNEIEDSKEIYKIKSFKRINFLKEQAAIARNLNISQNQIDENIDINKKETYYMKGYETIEKEIEYLNYKILNLSYDENISKLEKNKKLLISNRNIERLESIYNKTPIRNPEKFIGGQIIYETANIKKLNDKTSRKKIIIITAVIALIFSIIYVLILNAIKNRK